MYNSDNTISKHNSKTLNDFADIFTKRGKCVAIAIAGDENGDAIAISHPCITDKQLLNMLRDAAKRVEKRIEVQKAILN